MSILLTLVLLAQVLSALGVIVLVLLQHGKGADMGAAFGSGASGSLFGATGSANFLSRTTGVLATIFFVATLALAFLSNKAPTGSGSVMDQPAGASKDAAPKGGGAPAAPAAPGAAAPASAPAAAGAEAGKAGEAKPAETPATKAGGASDIPK